MSTDRRNADWNAQQQWWKWKWKWKNSTSQYEHLQMAINGRAGKNNFGRISKKKESEGRTEPMKIDQLSVNAVFV